MGTVLSILVGKSQNFCPSSVGWRSHPEIIGEAARKRRSQFGKRRGENIGWPFDLREETGRKEGGRSRREGSRPIDNLLDTCLILEQLCNLLL